MWRLIRISLLAVALCIVSAIWLLLESSDELIANYKPDIEAMLSKAVSQPITISALHLKILPQVAINIKGASIGGTDSCPAPMAVDDLSLVVGIRELLDAHLVFKSIRLSGGNVKLIRGERGFVLEGAGCSRSSGAPKGTDDATKPNTSDGNFKLATPFALDVHDLEARDVFITVSEAGRARKIEIKEFASKLAVNQDSSVSLATTNATIVIDGHRLDFTAPQISAFLLKGTALVEGLKVNYRGEQGIVTLEASDGFNITRATLQTDALNLENLTNLSKALGVATPKAGGIMRANVEFRVQSDGANTLTGDIELRKLTLSEPPVLLHSITLDKLKIQRGAKGQLSGAAKISVTNLSISTSKERYEVQQFGGAASVSNDLKTGTSVTGDFSVTKFSFDDGVTRVYDATALLKGIKTQITPGGTVTTALNLDGADVKVDHQDIKVRGAERVTAPLVVEVPAGGGYKVSGPVTVKNGRLTTRGKDFSEVSSVVHISVAKGAKNFKASEILFGVDGTSGKLGVSINMIPTAYEITGVNIGVLGAAASGDITWGRGVDANFFGSFSGTNVPLPFALEIATEKPVTDLRGIAKEVTAKFSGKTHQALDTLKGKGSINVAQGDLKSVNLTELIAVAIKQVPVLADAAAPLSGVGDDDAQKVATDFEILNKKAFLTKTEIVRPRYSLRGEGSVEFNGTMDFRGSVIMLESTFSSLGLGIKPLAELFGKVGKIDIPVFIKGDVNNPQVTPDLATLAKNNSGLPIASAVLGAVGKVGRGVVDVVTSPFRRKRKVEEGRDEYEKTD